VVCIGTTLHHLCGHEALLCTVREEHRLRVSESTGAQEAGSDRRLGKLYNGKLHDLYYLPSIIRMIR
jgi:hypothetical protein